MTEKRFKETISTGIVTDTITGKEYNCEMRIDDKLLELLNELHEENKKLKQQVEELYENDKSLRKMMGNMTHHFQGVSVKEDLFNEVLKVLKEIEADDLYDDLYKTSIDTGVNGC